VKQRRKAAPRKSKRPPAPGAWSLLPVDGTPLRQRARREYEKVQREIERAKLELERYHSEDAPRYAKWLNSHFGALLTESRELQEKLFQAQNLVNEVQQEFYFGCYKSIYEAYTVVLSRREHPEDFKDEEPEEPEEEDPAEAAFRREFEKLFGISEDELFERLGSDAGPWAPSPEPKAPGAGRLKDLYRSLARRLHPDSGGKRSAKETEWWHQTQAAYEAGNIEQLEVILTLVEIEEKGTTEASVSILQQITIQFKKGLNALRREIRRYRADAAWNFSRLDDFGPLLHRTRETLEMEKARLATLLQRCQAQIQSWEALGRPRPKARRRQPKYPEPTPWF
jgi:hypothetical protein